MSRHEIDGHENDGHENAGHVSGVSIGLRGIDFDLAVLPSNRLLLRFHSIATITVSFMLAQVRRRRTQGM